MTYFSQIYLNSNNSPFRFNAKELDSLSREAMRFGKETGNYYYGARYYDPKFSIWISVDPLAELMPEWSSYAYTFNNPVNFTDPDGRAPVWIPDGNGNLIAEENDNAQTLAEHLNINENEAQEMINEQGLARENYVELNSNVKENETLEVDNNMTRAIKQSNGRTTEDEFNNISDTPYDPIDKYFCHQGANAAVSGVSIGPGKGTNKSVSSLNGYEKVSPDQAVFGKTLVSWNNKHTAVYYGTSNSGDIFVWSKNGYNVKPGVFNINTINEIKEYGTDTNIFGNEVKIEPTFHNPVD